jgi:hypothetical protein
MKLNKLTPILIVDEIEPCLPAWEALGYAPTVRVPDDGAAGFVILSAQTGEVMLQTRASLVDDLPAVAELTPTHLLYADVASVAEATKALSGARVLVPRRKTFYGATEAWVELEGGAILGLAEHA